eukprot:INCI10441.4.p1 GENE.INCI10441.4~~INCI10441.4.p1  ORF type:complete len:945 (-),score=205.57 INCI10441.4:2340-5174(-)
MSLSGWVKGTKNGRPYYLNLDTHEETTIRPINFKDSPSSPRRGMQTTAGTGSLGGSPGSSGPAGAAKGSVSQQDCSDTAVQFAAEQLEAGIITAEEYNTIISTIVKAQEVDDVDQFLHHGQLQKFQSTESLPEEVSADPELIITDLSTGRKVHVVEADNIAPVHQYDSFENLYVTDITTGERIFLSEVQLEQFDTFSQTQRNLGARAGAAELRRQAKKLRDTAPADLQLKLFDALRDLTAMLATPRGQQALEEESSFFGGSLVKTRMAMVMAVQMKLKRRWERKPPSPRRKKGRGKRGSSPRRSSPRHGSGSAKSEELMSLAEFVDVVRFMGFNATLENAAEVVARWGKADRAGRIHFVNFLVWCDLEACFPRLGSSSANAIATSTGPAAENMSSSQRQSAELTSDLLAAAEELAAAAGNHTVDDNGMEIEGDSEAVDSVGTGKAISPLASVYRESSFRTGVDLDDFGGGEDEGEGEGLNLGKEPRSDLNEDEDEQAEYEELRKDAEQYRVLQQKYTAVMEGIAAVRAEYAESGDPVDEDALADAVCVAKSLKDEMERMDRERDEALRAAGEKTKAADLAFAALGVQHTETEGWSTECPEEYAAEAASLLGIGGSRGSATDDDQPKNAARPNDDSSDDEDFPSRQRSGTMQLLKQKHSAIVAGIAAARAQGADDEVGSVVAAAEAAAQKLQAQMDELEAEEYGGTILKDADHLPSDSESDSEKDSDGNNALFVRAAASGSAIARSRSANHLDDISSWVGSGGRSGPSSAGAGPKPGRKKKMQRHSSAAALSSRVPSVAIQSPPGRGSGLTPRGNSNHSSRSNSVDSQDDAILAAADAAAAMQAFERRFEGSGTPLPPKKKLDISHLEPLSVAKVAYDFKAVGDTELSVIAGEVLAIYQEIDNGWWYAMNELGEEGYVPMTFLQAVTEDEVASAAQSAGDKRIHI